MDNKLNPAVDNPVPATDQALNTSSSEAPAAVAEQGVSAAADQPKSPAANDGAELYGGEAPRDTADPTFGADPSAAGESPDAPQASEADAESHQVSREPEVSEAGESPEAPQASESATDSHEASRESEAAAETMTMADVMAASDDQLARKPVHRGMMTAGTVIMLSQEGIVVDVGAKIEGLIPYNQVFEYDLKADEASKYFKPGDEVQVYVIRADIPNNTIVLSKKRADQERAWNLLQEIYEKKLPVEVEVIEKVRGGLVASLGVRAFLPASQVDVRRINDLSPFVGQRMKVRIIELNRKRNRVIISRRSIVEEEVAGKKAETLERLEPGAQLEGEVVEITDFGVFVNLGGVDGLVHRSEIGYGRFNHPKEVLQLGQKVKVEVLDMDLERERINLSMKRLIGDPWQNVLATYHIGQKVAGKVTNLTPFGAFVEIEPGLEGLIHVSEMSWTKRVRHPKEIVQEGSLVEAMILKIDLDQKRISLGLRQTQPDPWSSLPDRYPPGTEITGPITGLTEFGVFMEIEEGIEGLIHISELAHERIGNVAEHFNKGDEVTAVILNIDPVEQRASLSRKRLLPYTAGAHESAAEAPSGRSTGGRKGRRGGRRSAGIDYDYSYASADVGTKATTKLGDVYADLFAQFGLTETKSEKAETKPAPKPEAKAEAPQPKPEPAAKPEAEVEPENVIDAAEAAALLTAAFRLGKRPSLEPERPREPEESETPQA